MTQLQQWWRRVLRWLGKRRRFGAGSRALSPQETQRVLDLKRSGASNRAVSRATGIHRATVARIWERRHLPSLTLEDFAQQAQRITPDETFGDQGTAEPRTSDHHPPAAPPVSSGRMSAEHALRVRILTELITFYIHYAKRHDPTGLAVLARRALRQLLNTGDTGLDLRLALMESDDEFARELAGLQREKLVGEGGATKQKAREPQRKSPRQSAISREVLRVFRQRDRQADLQVSKAMDVVKTALGPKGAVTEFLRLLRPKPKVTTATSPSPSPKGGDTNQLHPPGRDNPVEPLPGLPEAFYHLGWGRLPAARPSPSDDAPPQ